MRRPLSIALLAASACSAPPSEPPPDPGWTLAAPMRTPRFEHAAVRLPGGEVLVSGGRASRLGDEALAEVEIYNVETDSWRSAPAMEERRAGHTATPLEGGVLVVGGRAAATAIFDAGAGAWRAGPAEPQARSHHSATRLESGGVLIAGGIDEDRFLSSAAIFDPESETLEPTAPMAAARARHAAARLADGRVLVAGGEDAEGFLSSVEIFDPEAGAWTSAAPLPGPTGFGHVALRLAGGDVLVAGGRGPGASDHRDAAVLYDRGADAWTELATLSSARTLLAAAETVSGEVLLVGGCDPCHAFALVERLDPDTGALRVEGFMNRGRCGFTMTELEDGALLVAGGVHAAGEPGASTEIHRR